MFHSFLSTTGTTFVYAHHAHINMCLEVSYPRMEGSVNEELLVKICPTSHAKQSFH